MNFWVCFPQVHVATGGRRINEIGGSSASVATSTAATHLPGAENEARELREIAHAHVLWRSKEQKPAETAEPGTPHRFTANDTERHASFDFAHDASVHH